MSEPVGLTRVPGVGRAHALWLADTFGVWTAAELAALDQAEITAWFATGRRWGVSRSALERWVAAARRITEAETQVTGEPTAPTESGSEPVWVPTASFVVEFQARRNGTAAEEERVSLHHVERDHTETIDGGDRHRLVHRLDELLGAPTAPSGQWHPVRPVPTPRPAPAFASTPSQPAPPQPAPPRPTRPQPVPESTAPTGHPVTGPEPAPPVSGSSEPATLGPGAGPLRSRTAGPVALLARIDPAPATGCQLVALDQPWAVVFEWSFDVPNEPGTWLLDAILNPLGPGDPIQPGGHPRSVPSERGRTGYRVAMECGPADCADMPIGTLLRGTATVRFHPEGADRAVAAGFADLGVVSFWRPGAG